MQQRKSEPIEDCELLRLILSDLIRLVDGKVTKYHNKKMRYYLLTERVHKKDGRLSYNIWIGKRQRTVQKNRLIYMIVNRELIPSGFDIDHWDRDKLNNEPDNLRIRDMSENRSDNISKANLDDVMNFFSSKSNGGAF